MKKFCPECLKEGRRSTITVGGTIITLMNVHTYYDEDGNYRVDDPNVTTTSYSCSNGHHWTEKA